MKTIRATLLVVLLTAQSRGQKMEFRLYEIGEFGERMGRTTLVDVDRDGDIDICTKPWNGNLHIYLENPLIQ